MSAREVSLEMRCEQESFMAKVGNGANVLILGMGLSGRAAARLAVNRGFSVLCVDEFEQVDRSGLDGIAIIAGWKTGDPLPAHDLIVTSPGISPDSGLGMAAAASEAPIVGELEFASAFTDAPILAVTGTNGKTTTTEMTKLIFGDEAVAAGNIGKPLSEVALEEWRGPVVLEASSFQLETIDSFAPVAAALLNISPDHLDRHASFAEYVSAKFAVFRNIPEPSNSIINSSLLDDWKRIIGKNRSPSTFSASENGSDAFFRDNRVVFKDIPIAPVDLSASRISGRHNVENFMAAVMLASKILPSGALEEGILRLIREFRISPHRQEVVAEVNGVRFINDSKATNPDSLFTALDVFGDDGNILLIAGGLDKNMDFSISRKRAATIRSAFLIGESAEKIRGEWEGEGVDCLLCASFELAIREASAMATTGDVVMLSPGCASMDMFTNYKERGDIFRKIILQN